MYNAEQKSKFIDWYSGKNNIGRNTISSTINKLSQYEGVFGCDLVDFSKNQIIEAISDAFDDYDAIRGHCITILRAYTNWMGAETSDVLSVKTSDIDIAPALSHILIPTPISLFEEISKVKTFDDGYPEPVLCALAWCGLSWTEAISLPDSSVNLDTAEIILNGDILPIDPEPAEILRRFRSCKNSNRDNRMGTYPVIKDMTTDKFLKKFFSPNSNRFGQEFTRSQLDTGMSKFVSAYEGTGAPPRLSYKNILRSGGFYRLRKLEESGVDISSPKNKALVRQTYRAPKDYNSLRVMYRFYKRAFNLA